MPDSPWVMTQTWHILLFAHWRMPATQLRPKVPSHFDLDLFDGTGWIGVVPFHMTNVAPRGVPSMPWMSEFPELNVRTYVRVDNRPGVYFFSLDAGNRVAVRAARSLFNLPYYTAAMTVSLNGDEVRYDSRRKGQSNTVFEATYRPAGRPFVSVEGSLEHFLTERYCLYNLDHKGRPYRMDIHHPPWTLHIAEAHMARNTMADAAGFTLTAEPLLHFSRRQDMVAWAPSPP